MRSQPKPHLNLTNTSGAAVSTRSDLAQSLRAGTRQHHTDAERAGVMPGLLRGQLSLLTYRALLHNLHAIYAALEPALDAHASHACIAPTWSGNLRRCGALQDDMSTLAAHDTGVAPAPVLLPAALAYVRRIDDLARSEPCLLLAHAHVRYLGDLSGGQILARIVAKAYGLPADGQGTRFYDFGDADTVHALCVAWRAGLKNTPVDDALTAQLVAEAQSAFQRHQDLFVELQA